MGIPSWECHKWLQSNHWYPHKVTVARESSGNPTRLSTPSALHPAQPECIGALGTQRSGSVRSRRTTGTWHSRSACITVAGTWHTRSWSAGRHLAKPKAQHRIVELRGEDQRSGTNVTQVRRTAPPPGLANRTVRMVPLCQLRSPSNTKGVCVVVVWIESGQCGCRFDDNTKGVSVSGVAVAVRKKRGWE